MENFDILVIDDEKNIRRSMDMILTGEGYSVRTSENIESGWDEIRRVTPALVFLDVLLPDGNGLQLLSKIKTVYPDTEVVVMSGHANIDMAVEATRKGAYDFLEKPLKKEKIVITVNQLKEKFILKEKNRQIENEQLLKYEMTGNSRELLKVKEQINMVAQTTSKVLITGESGTGKELVAWAIHHQSSRRRFPFVKVNCAAIPENLIESELFGYEKGAFTGAVSAHDGKFLQADKGTIFLDEVADMSRNTQTKVLRVLQEGQFERVGGNKSISVDVRVIAATNKSLEELVNQGEFREDLYYRLNVFPIENPPLRNRKKDIPLLVHRFIETYCRENNRKSLRIEDDVIKLLQEYAWPGNIRELKNIVERMIIQSVETSINRSSLPSHIAKYENTMKPEFPDNLSLKQYREQTEREYIRYCLDKSDGNISKAADMLGMERTNLHKKMKSLGMS